MKVLLLAACFALGLIAAESTTPFWPATTYDATIPTLQKVAGHAPGERITTPADIVR